MESIFEEFQKSVAFPRIASGAKNDIYRSSEKLSVYNGLCACVPVTEMFVIILNDGQFLKLSKTCDWTLSSCTVQKIPSALQALSDS